MKTVKIVIDQDCDALLRSRKTPGATWREAGRPVPGGVEISIGEDTLERLDRERRNGETYSDVIRRALGRRVQ